MTPTERRDALCERVDALSAALYVADCPDTPLTDWALRDMAHHLGEAERLIAHLNAREPELEASAF